MWFPFARAGEVQSVTSHRTRQGRGAKVGNGERERGRESRGDFPFRVRMSADGRMKDSLPRQESGAGCTPS